MDTFFANLNIAFRQWTWVPYPVYCDRVERAISLLVERAADVKTSPKYPTLASQLRVDEVYISRVTERTMRSICVYPMAIGGFGLRGHEGDLHLLGCAVLTETPQHVAAYLCPELTDTLRTPMDGVYDALSSIDYDKVWV